MAPANAAIINFKICPDADCQTKAGTSQGDGVLDPLVGTPVGSFGWSVVNGDGLQPVAVDLHAPFNDMDLEFFFLEIGDNGFGIQVVFFEDVMFEGETDLLQITYEVVGEPEFGQVVDFVFEDGVFGAPPISNFALSGGVPQDIVFFAGSMTLEVVPFLRGDVNGDSLVNMADTIWLLNDFFQGGPSGPCMSAADVNDDSIVDVGDAVYILDYRFLDGPPPPAPFPACGFDPSADFLECNPVCP